MYTTGISETMKPHSGYGISTSDSPGWPGTESLLDIIKGHLYQVYGKGQATLAPEEWVYEKWHMWEPQRHF